MTDWYADGLSFGCTRCGNCCKGAPGMVRASDAEVLALAEHLELDEHAFRDEYTHRLGSGGTTLRERSGGACVFWREEAGCVVYSVRPRQCRTWPFWKANLASERHWAEAAKGCPGIGQGERVDAAEIRERSAADGTSGKVPEL